MPYIDLQSKPDYASIFYTTNTTYRNISGFHPDKPTVVILHPLLLDSSWLCLQFGDPRLNDAYNLISFDMRSCGRSFCRLDARHDSWVDAADLALCFQKLYLPPSHIFALEVLSVNCALRFALLFPEMCLSLTLVNIPAPTMTQNLRSSLEALLVACCFPVDLESFQHAVQENVQYLFGEDCDPDMQDEVISFWTTTFPPRQRPRLVETCGVLANRTPLKPEIYALITQPVLIIHGDKNDLYPIEHAERLLSQLTGVKDGAILYSVKGGSLMLSVIPGNASIVNKVVSNFWARLPHHSSHLRPPETPVEVRMSEALETLAMLTGRANEVSTAEPLCSLSFSCLPPDVIKIQSELLEYFKKDCHRAFSPSTTSSGRPLRKFSERESEHWFSAGVEGLSIANSSFLHPKRTKNPSERLEKKVSRPDFSIRSPVDTTTETITIKGSAPKTHGKSSTPA